MRSQFTFSIVAKRTVIDYKEKRKYLISPVPFLFKFGAGERWKKSVGRIV
jgi:hypothetical protein